MIPRHSQPDDPRVPFPAGPSPVSLPVALAIAMIACIPTRHADAAEPRLPATVSLGRQREMQERARALAREFAGGVLEEQLRKLEENGLADRPVYAEVEELRANVETLVDEEMADVIDLLAAADAAGGPAREEAVRKAQRAVRRITVQLAAEQRQLQRRLKMADITAQVRRLTESQEAVLAATEGLARQPERQIESAVLGVREQQRTIRQLYAGLVETLEEVRTWEGPVGQGAANGLRNLEERNAAAALDTAEERLGATDVPATTEAQREFLAALAAIDEAIAEAQGMAASASSSAADAASQLGEQSRQLSEQIASSSMTDQEVESLVNKQSQLREKIEQLASQEQAAAQQQQAPGQDTPAPSERQQGESPASQARAAAAQAMKELFAGNRDQARAAQDRATEAIESMARQMGRESAESRPKKPRPPRSGSGEGKPQPESSAGSATADDTRPPSSPPPPAAGNRSGAADTVDEASGDAAPGDLPIEEESWFAKLPAETRQALRAKARQKIPRGYEQKLDRYFKSTD